MKCPYCNAENEENAVFCKECGKTFMQEANTNGTAQAGYQPPQGAYNPGYAMPPQEPRPVFNNTSAIVSIIFSLFCSGWIGIIFSVIGLVKGNKVDTLYAMGDYQGAANAAAEGNKYVKISWIINVVLLVIGILGTVLMIATGVLAGLAGGLS